MGQKTGLPPLYLVTPAPEPRSRQLAQDAVARLEQGRAMLVEAGHTETARLLDIALLQLRLTTKGVSDAEFRSFCDALAESGPVAADQRGADGA